MTRPKSQLYLQSHGVAAAQGFDFAFLSYGQTEFAFEKYSTLAGGEDLAENLRRRRQTGNGVVN
jgi:hypothetical protein